MAAGASKTTAIIAQAFNCADELARVIAAKATSRHFQPRATIVHAGDATSSLYLVIEGHAQAIAVSADGRAVLVQDFHSGDLFGEGGVMSDGISEEDVQAVSAVDASQFRSEVFIGLIESYASVGLAVSRLIVARLYRTTRRMVEGATLSANGRVYADLAREAKLMQGCIRPLPIISEIALRAQTTRETASRAINILEKKGIIRRDSEGLTVIAIHRLEEMIF